MTDGGWEGVEETELPSVDGASTQAVWGEDTDAQRPERRPVHALERGSVVGRYTVLDRLGAGGMGVVYAAYDETLDRKVALKMLRSAAGPSRASNDAPTELGDGARRMLREAQAMARLSHPNVVTVHDVDTYDDQVFLAMEYVEGQTLASWIAADPKRPWRDIVAIFGQAAAGLMAAHEAGLVHRDFKPENVMLGKDGRVRVMDFGLARAAEEVDDAETTGPREPRPAPKPSAPDAEPGAAPTTGAESSPAFGAPVDAPVDPEETLVDSAGARASARTPRSASGGLSDKVTRTGVALGTPAYMSPEQHRGEVTDARSDQFSFCVALYEALYGRRPFPGTSVAELA